ncbi:MAG: anion permease [Clostridiales Family XIII bacterium]|jgi:sodium-dependent dicarboxylate transporter 2/3/5|nr:anion permease [Clostridiales Family XIII bacterium]
MNEANQKVQGASSEPAPNGKKANDAAYYVKVIVCILVMLFVGKIPAPEPITQIGMTALGLFIGLVALWTLVDITWPTVLVVIFFGAIAPGIWPDSLADAGGSGWFLTLSYSFGQWNAVFVLNILFLCFLMERTGLARRIALWFITTKYAKKSPWSFTFMFLLATFVIGLFFNVSPAQLMLFAIAKEIFSALGMTKDDKWTHIIYTGITFTVMIGFAATPVAHDITILFMSILQGLAGGLTVNWVAYMLVTVPAAAVVWFLMFLFFRYCTKCDMRKLENIDFGKIEAMKPTKMNAREKFFTIGFVVLIVVWLAPATIGLFAPQAGIVTFFEHITLVTPLLVLLVLFCIVKIDGEPVLDIPVAASKLNWSVYFMMAGIMLTSNALSADATGIIPFVIMSLGPIVSGLSPFAFVLAMIVISVILTNILNNIPVAIILMSAAVPLAMEMGMNPFVIGVPIMFASGMAFALPSSFVPIGCCYAEPFGGPRYTIKYGAATMVVAIVVCGILMYPLSALVFGA